MYISFICSWFKKKKKELVLVCHIWIEDELAFFSQDLIMYYFLYSNYRSQYHKTLKRSSQSSI